MQKFPIDLFMQKVKQVDEHWMWTAAVGGQGKYGIYTWVLGGKRVTKMAHRWAYMYYVSPIPDGLVLDHKCRIHLCVNPFECLEPVTNQVNTDRGVNAKQLMCGKGLHPMEGDNILMHPKGRMCKRCAYDRTLAWKKGGK